MNASTFDLARHTELKRKFLAWEQATLKGYEVRSREESTVKEEPSFYHIKQANENSRKSMITELETQDNRKVTEEREIRDEIVAHFRGISTDQPSPDHYLKDRFLKEVRGVLTADTSQRNEPGSNNAVQLIGAPAPDLGRFPGRSLARRQLILPSLPTYW